MPTLVRLAWEHTHRELLPALLFLHQLSRRGIPWALEHVAALSGGQPGARELLLLPFYYDETDTDRYLFRGGLRGKWVVNLAYEQMHFACGRAYLLPDGPFARTQMIHCAWGPRFRELLLGHGIPAERIRVTGHLRFDVYHHPELLLTRAELAARFGLDPDRPWILAPYNFNMAYVTRANLRDLAARKYELAPGFVEGTARARDAFTVMLRALCDAFPDHEVVLRAHPAGYEDAEQYRAEAARRRNLKIICVYDIANWIQQAALTIVWNSTSGLEAMVAGRPVISYEPEPYHEVFDYDVNRILPTYRTVDEVLDVVSRLPDPGLRYDWALFERWYEHRDGKNIERLLALVDEAQAGGPYAVEEPPPPVWTARWRRALETVTRPLPDGARKVLGLRGHRAPPADALDAAVRDLTPKPLDQFLA
jgi:surface carbohydrate biosynthesis protein